MTDTKTIAVLVSPKGETKIETQGFAGRECLEASRFLETALGSKTSDRLTAEFYQQQTNQHHLPLNSSHPRNRL